MLRYWFVVLGAVVGCSSGEGELLEDEHDCQSINEQICQRWAAESADAGKPCDPPQTTVNTDFTGACGAADKKCSTPATSLSCPGSN